MIQNVMVLMVNVQLYLLIPVSTDLVQGELSLLAQIYLTILSRRRQMEIGTEKPIHK